MIRDIPYKERPRERCLEEGASVLSLRECLAVILGSGPPGVGCIGLAQRVLERFGIRTDCFESELEVFYRALESRGHSSLKEVPGLGDAGRSRILAAFELGRRYSLYRERRVTIDHREGDSNMIKKLLMRIPLESRGAEKEWIGFIPIFQNRRIGTFHIIEKGNRTHVNFEPSELFAQLLPLRPEGVALFHNHPSGSLRASLDDVRLTEQLDELSQSLGVHLIGHWIVTVHGHKEIIF